MDFQDVLSFWFGAPGESEIPMPERSNLWFGFDTEMALLLDDQFATAIVAASEDQYAVWQQKPQGCLALVLLLDQFPRKIYHHSANAYAHDEQALQICLAAIEQAYDQELTLMERVFFYMPLQHAEDLEIQSKSVAAYKSLLELSLDETQALYKTFLMIATQRYNIIEEFGRFPMRNASLSRESAPEEALFLSDLQKKRQAE